MKETGFEDFASSILQDRNLRGNSKKWANWMSALTLFTCKYCVDHHGTIVDISILNYLPTANAHKNCKCIYVPMRTKKIGTATTRGYSGADAWLFYKKKLPNYYMTKKQAQQSGWHDWNGNLNDILPGKMIGGNVYNNRNKKLPSAPGRTWYEADINYESGYRNRQRILYSNDGLIFVTYDHYQTFYEMIK